MKRKALLDTAFSLFTNKGIHKTSISDIVENAGVAKGTFYLYFKDKYDINNKLIAHKSSEIFRKADAELLKTDITELDEKIIFIVDNIISQFTQDKALLSFISKKLNWGSFKNVMLEMPDEDGFNFHDFYFSVFGENSIYDNPEIMLYMIIEFVSSVCYSSILYNEPVGIDELKPYILRTVRQIMSAHKKQ
jgi:AcrR family transcriptional regulator